MGRARIVSNPTAAAAPRAAVDGEPLRFHRSLPGYEPTRLVDAPSVARALGVRRVWVKDESRRLGMPSFKILGASWATFRAVCERLGTTVDEVGDLPSLKERLDHHRPFTLIAATDGNHGRAVARMAALLDLEARILVPSDMARARIDAIAGEGAAVDIVDGTYDDAIAAAARVADDAHLLISDTSWPGYQAVPRWVIDGYATIAQEIEEELAARGAGWPDVIAAQIGVGAFAASMVERFRRDGSRLVGVEPARADCATASIEAGRLVSVPGPHDSIMAGLNCGTPSLIAWPVISKGIDVYVAVDDDRAREAMRLLAEAGIVSGETGAAGVAGLLDLAGDGGLPADSEVLTVSTEGATDPAAYAEIVGAPAEEIERRAAAREAGGGAELRLT
jgi:diaminopropionate ammonia-lyase